MFQDLVTDHLGKFTPTYSNVYNATANRSFRNTLAVANNELVVCGNLGGTPTAGQWVLVGGMVSDPDFVGPCVFSYEAVAMGNTSPLAFFPVLLDRQGAAATPAGTNYTFQNTTDFGWSVPSCDITAGAAWRMQARGRRLVDTRLQSATPGITVREFGVSLAVQLPATVTEISFLISCRLYKDQAAFYQPGK